MAAIGVTPCRNPRLHDLGGVRRWGCEAHAGPHREGGAAVLINNAGHKTVKWIDQRGIEMRFITAFAGYVVDRRSSSYRTTDHRWPCGCRGPCLVTNYGVRGPPVDAGRDAAGHWTRCAPHGLSRIRGGACHNCAGCAAGGRCSTAPAPRYSETRHAAYPAAARRIAAAALPAMGRRAARALAYQF